MTQPIVVQIIGAPVACAEGTKDAWREVAMWAADQLTARFGDAVQVEYYDLFDPNLPLMPSEAGLPLVLVQGELISHGAKISIPTIRRKIESVLGSAGSRPAPEYGAAKDSPRRE